MNSTTNTPLIFNISSSVLVSMSTTISMATTTLNTTALSHNDTDSDVTTLPRRTLGERVVWSAVLTMILMASLIGNLLVILCVRLNYRLREEKGNIFIVNLSVTDMLSAVIVMLSSLHALAGDEWLLGSVWCDIVCGANYMLIIVSMLTLCFISFDRYFAVVHAMHYHIRVTKRKIYIMIAYAWFQGFCFGIAPILCGWIRYDYWEIVCAIVWHEDSRDTLIYVIIAFIVCFLTPGVALVCAYTRVMKVAKKHLVISVPAASLPAPQAPQSTTIQQDTADGMVTIGMGQLEQTDSRNTNTRTTNDRGSCQNSHNATESQRGSGSPPQAFSAPSTPLRRPLNLNGLSRQIPAHVNSDLEYGPATPIRRITSTVGAWDKYHCSRHSSSDFTPGIRAARLAELYQVQRLTALEKGSARCHRVWFLNGSNRVWARKIADTASLLDDYVQSRSDVPTPRLRLDSIGSKHSGMSLGSSTRAVTSRALSCVESGRATPYDFSRDNLAYDADHDVFDINLNLGGLTHSSSEPNMPSFIKHFDDLVMKNHHSPEPTEHNNRVEDLRSQTPDRMSSVATEEERTMNATCSRPQATGHKPRMGHKRNYSASSKAVRSLFIVVMAYFICMTPFSITKLYKVIVPDADALPGYVNLVASLFQYCSSAINPLIYGIFRKDFQRAFVLLLKRLMDRARIWDRNTSDYLTRNSLQGNTV